MKFLVVIPLILFGAFLFGLTIDSLGDIGNLILKLLGGVCLFVAILIGRKKK
ncbi:serine kinase [Pseudalkalibacillus berkeleyi]|uniref:Serine kinase n=1 Tax=Pseudalkalibacillus berkeleyi TaxID=1069813 RepID=A0ABS9GXB2_9BACL|nr:serine kinase [Pseudalkalibacillus berkeleyi]MCF6136456.1 serine kinase [Pseudalkalibacillus berkeleyi]